MTTPICEHLDEYGAQFARTEATYRQCMDGLDRILAQGPLPALVRAAVQALQEWSAEDAKLRDMLVAEVRAGRVRVPRGLLRADGLAGRQAQRQARRKGHPVCTACRQVLPRLAYPEWSFAHNGTATFRGVEFPLFVAAPV